MKIPMELSKNLGYEHESDSPRYFLKIDLDEIAPGRKATIPIRWRANKSHPMLKEIYYADVGGFRIEKGNLQMLRTSIQEAVESLVDHRTLPYYSISLPNLTRIPVFLIGKHLKLEDAEIRVSGEDIGEVCRKLAKELVQKKEIKGVDDLKVSIFLWADLRLYPPAFIIKDFRQRAWVPIFCHNSEGSLGLNFDIINMPSKIFRVEELSSLRKEVISYLSSRKYWSVQRKRR